MEIRAFTPHPDQRRVINAIEGSEAKYIILTTGRQWGKTMLGINMLLKWALTTPNASTMWVSPVYSQSKRVMSIMYQAIADTKVVKSINKSEMVIELFNGSNILFRSAEREDNLRGHTLDYLVVDESAFIKDVVWDTVLRQTTLIKGRRVLFISTPRGKNFLYSLHIRGLDPTQTAYLSLRGSSYDTPYISKEELDEAKESLPDDIFRQEIMAEFIDNGGEVFTNIDEYCKINQWSTPQGGKTYYAGLDLGRTNDWTVLTIFDEYGNVVYIWRDRQKSWEYIVGEVLKHTKRYNANLLVEVNNVGDVIYEQLKKEYQKAEPFVTKNDNKQNIIEDLLYGLNKGEVMLPTEELFGPLYAELKTFTFEYSPKTRRVSYKARDGMHDDCIMSLAIGYNCLKQKKTKGTYYVY